MSRAGNIRIRAAEKRLQAAVPGSGRKRDLGLDLLRVIALVMMITGHYSKVLPEPNLFIRILDYIFNLGAAFFFFAFGMTMDYFLRKDLKDQIQRFSLFFLLGVCHSLYLRDLLRSSEFFMFLCLWQIFFLLIDKVFRRSVVVISGLALASSAALFLPKSIFDLNVYFDALLPGPFPLLPWGIYILFGYVYQDWKKRSELNDLSVGVAFFLFWISSVFLHRTTGLEAFQTEKWYLTFPYIAMSSAIIFGLLHLAGKADSWYQRMHFLKDKISFASENLLFAVVLHYIPLKIFLDITAQFSPETVAAYNTWFMVAALLLLNSALYLLLGVFVSMMDRFRKLDYPFWLGLAVCIMATGILTYVIYVRIWGNPIRFLTANTTMLIISSFMGGAKKKGLRPHS